MLISWQSWIGLTLLIASSARASEELSQNATREGKVTSIFTIVKFQNSPCSTQSISSSSTGSGRRNGTCYTEIECSSKGGQASGSCASGFGVCCLFTKSTCGSQLEHNCSYFQNPGFPTAYSAVSSCSFTVKKCADDVCFLRLDFESFTIVGPTGTTEVDGGKCATDTFTVSALNTGASVIPTICGQNTGQHMYVDVGLSSADTATFNFAFSGTSTSRAWEIKVTQIPCTSRTKPPTGCLQYHTRRTGRFTTFNFLDTQTSNLAAQDYKICIRREEGMCCIMYKQCTDQTDSFTLDGTTAAAMQETAIDSGCTKDYIQIDGALDSACNNNYQYSRFCKNTLFAGIQAAKATGMYPYSYVCDCTAPFSVRIHTDTVTDATTTSRGACIDYIQRPCGTGSA